MCVNACPYNAIVKVTVPCEDSCPVGAIKKDETVNVNINPEQPLESETTLIVIANIADLGKLN